MGDSNDQGDKIMMNFNERYLIDAQGNQLGVFLDMADYDRILKALEELELFRASNREPPPVEEPKVQPTSLSDLLDSVAANQERMTLTYKRKVFIAAVPIDDEDLIKSLKKCINKLTTSPSEPVIVQNSLGELLEYEIADKKARLTVIYQEKVFLAAVHIKDFELVQKLDKCLENADVDEAMEEEGLFGFGGLQKSCVMGKVNFPRADNALIEPKSQSPTLCELLEGIAANKERTTLTYKKWVFIAVVPVEDVDVIEQLEECLYESAEDQPEPIPMENGLGDLLERQVTKKNERVTLIFRNQLFLAAVPVKDAEMVEQLDECIDNADVDDVLEEEGLFGGGLPQI
jgi:hypothetical protein